MENSEILSGDGPSGGALVISEKPSKADLKSGKGAFSSKSSLMLRRWCAEMGLKQVRYEYLNSPTFNHAMLSQAKVIVAAGEKVLHSITNEFGRIDDVHAYVIRDSMLTSAPVIPTFAPEKVMVMPTNAYWMKYAIQKAKAVMDGAKDKPIIIISDNDVQKALLQLEFATNSGEISIDIETLKFNPILNALGFAYESGGNIYAVSISSDADEWELFVSKMLEVLESPFVIKIGQNFSFDCGMLWKIYGAMVKGPIWDTMHAANVINCEIEKSLKALGRLYFYSAPWKGGWNTSGEKLRIYNAQDCGNTLAIQHLQQRDLQRLQLDKYFELIRQLFIPSLTLALRGIQIDESARQKATKNLEEVLEPIVSEVQAYAKPFVPSASKSRFKRNPAADEKVEVKNLNEIPESEQKEIYTAKAQHKKFGLEPGALYRKAYDKTISLEAQGFNVRSPKQLLGVLNNSGVRVPKVKKSNDEWGESTNDKALAQIIERNSDTPETLDFVHKMRFIRQGSKLLSSYCKAKLDEDNRWRCSYNIEGTDTGRSSTKKTPWQTGGNNQNIPRDGFGGVKFKSLFIPDNGKVFFQSDQEQAEARVVAYLAGCKKLIELFETKQDVHIYAINSILGEDIGALKEKDPKKFKLYRQYGKIVNHGGNYDMGPATLSENAIKQGIILSIKQAEYFLLRRKQVFPEIYGIFHEGIKKALHKGRTLFTPFGRRRFFMGILDNAVYRQAYAYIPQSTVPHLTNLMWLWANELSGKHCEVMQMGHDALLMQGTPEVLKEFIPAFMKQTQELKFDVNEYKNINIPWDAQTGHNWSEMKKWEG